MIRSSSGMDSFSESFYNRYLISVHEIIKAGKLITSSRHGMGPVVSSSMDLILVPGS